MGGAHQEGFGFLNFILVLFPRRDIFFLLHIHLSVLWASLCFLYPAEILGVDWVLVGCSCFPADASWPVAFFLLLLVFANLLMSLQGGVLLLGSAWRSDCIWWYTWQASSFVGPTARAAVFFMYEYEYG